MTATEEITKTVYKVGDKEFAVGDVLDLPDNLKDTLREITTCALAADETLKSLYRKLLLGEDVADLGDVENAYFITFNEADQRRKYLTAKLNRDLHVLHGGFIPVQLELTDDPVAIVREKGPNEQTSITEDQISDQLNITGIGEPLRLLLIHLGGSDTVDFEYEDWKTCGTLVLQAQTNVKDVMSFGETIESLDSNELYKSLMEFYKETTDVSTLPYTLLTVCESTVRVAGFVPGPHVTNDAVGRAYATLLNIFPDEAPKLSVNIFVDMDPPVEGSTEPQRILNFMFVKISDNDTTMVNSRFDMTSDGLKFREFWTPKEIAERAQGNG